MRSSKVLSPALPPVTALTTGASAPPKSAPPVKVARWPPAAERRSVFKPNLAWSSNAPWYRPRRQGITAGTGCPGGRSEAIAGKAVGRRFLPGYDSETRGRMPHTRGAGVGT